MSRPVQSLLSSEVLHNPDCLFQGGSERILIVEDEAPFREALQELLEATGFQSYALESVEEALSYLRHSSCHLILSDIRLPGLDGFDLLRHVADCCPETAVIMITGICDTQVAVNCLSAGAYDYITKPFLATDLATKIVNALDRRRLMAARHHHHSEPRGTSPGAESSYPASAR